MPHLVVILEVKIERPFISAPTLIIIIIIIFFAFESA